MDRFKPYIHPQYVIASLQYPLDNGIKLHDIGKAAAINLDNLYSRTEYFTLDEVMRLIKVIKATSNIPHYGLKNGNHIQFGCHGIAGISILYQSTYAECLQAGSRLGNLLFPPLELEYFETPDHVGMRLYECVSLAPYTRYFMEWIMIHFRNIFQFLLGPDKQPAYIAFPYSRPDYSQYYEEMLACTLKFDVEHAEFVVDRKLAEQEMPLANTSISAQAESTFLTSIADKELDITREVRALLARHLDAVPSLEDVAELLQVSSRTLRRNLKKQGTSYVEIVEDLRRETAISKLLNSNQSITDIAISLDFYDTSSFSKAFKRWTGQSPRAFRAAISECSSTASLAHSLC